MMLDDLEQTQRLINTYGAVLRNHYTPGTNMHERDDSHAFSVALLSWQLYDALDLSRNLDLTKILQYALVHDIPETYAGDVGTYAPPDERHHKTLREQAALRRISEEFGRIFGALPGAIASYEEKSDEESVFVWTVDKIQAYVQGNIDDWRPYHELPVSEDMFDTILETQLEKSHHKLRGLLKQVATDYRSRFIITMPRQPHS